MNKTYDELTAEWEKAGRGGGQLELWNLEVARRALRREAMYIRRILAPDNPEMRENWSWRIHEASHALNMARYYKREVVRFEREENQARPEGVTRLCAWCWPDTKALFALYPHLLGTPIQYTLCDTCLCGLKHYLAGCVCEAMSDTHNEACKPAMN